MLDDRRWHYGRNGGRAFRNPPEKAHSAPSLGPIPGDFGRLLIPTTSAEEADIIRGAVRRWRRFGRGGLLRQGAGAQRNGQDGQRSSNGSIH